MGKFNQKGSLLIEVLVALVVLTVGLLGLASLQMVSIKNMNNAQFRSLATTYSYDMAERMRSNRSAVEDGAYDEIDGTETTPNCSTCTPVEIAQMDAALWNQLIGAEVNDGGLPEGVGTVTKKGSIYEIKVVWEEQDRDSDGGKLESTDFVLTIQM